MKSKTMVLNLQSDSLLARFQRLSPGRKFMVVVLTVWLLQALPKWTAAFNADGELSAQIMKTFITPRTVTMSMSENEGANLLVDTGRMEPVSDQLVVSY